LIKSLNKTKISKAKESLNKTKISKAKDIKDRIKRGLDEYKNKI